MSAEDIIRKLELAPHPGTRTDRRALRAGVFGKEQLQGCGHCVGHKIGVVVPERFR